MKMRKLWTGNLKVSGYLVAVAGIFATWITSSPVAGSLQASAQAPQQPSEVAVFISGDPGTPPRYAVPDFIAASPDATEAAKTITQVLWDDLAFEREFYLIPRDTYSTIPPARSADQVPFAAWRELGADAVFFGTVTRMGNDIRVEVRLFNIRTQQSVFAREYTGAAANPRLYAHTIADEIHLQQRALRGVARTKLAFTSDRDGERIGGPVEARAIQEIYISDYDGANQRRVTVGRNLNLSPVWSPDVRALAYTSYRKGFPDILVSFIYQGKLDYPANGTERSQNFLPAWSPDGTKI